MEEVANIMALLISFPHQKSFSSLIDIYFNAF